LAAPEGYVRTFVDHGLPMQRLLGAAAAHGLASDYVAFLLSAFPSTLSNDEPPSRGTGFLDCNSLVEPLSDKELSMLRLMAAGRSNREIGDTLFLSVNTVKVYATRLYSKLAVHRRGEAVARAQELGLL
jgi:LuxR family maltose regulon positive regulatory protein